MRILAYASKDKKGPVHFSKRTRRKLIFLACQVVGHGREVIIRYSKRVYGRVEDLMRKISSLEFGFV